MAGTRPVFSPKPCREQEHSSSIVRCDFLRLTSLFRAFEFRLRSDEAPLGAEKGVKYNMAAKKKAVKGKKVAAKGKKK